MWKAFAEIVNQDNSGLNVESAEMGWNSMANGTNRNAKLERNSFADIPVASHLQYKSLNGPVWVGFFPASHINLKAVFPLSKSAINPWPHRYFLLRNQP